MTAEERNDRTSARPFISVIMIFFNAERFIEEALQSVLDQTYQHFELILVDDGSTDGSTSIAKAWAAKHEAIRYFEHPNHSNRGMSASRNRGIEAARGEWIAFIDADDVWMPTKLEGQIEVANRNPAAGMICGSVCNWRSWNGGTDVIVPTGHVANRLVTPPGASLALYPLGKAAAPCPSDMMLKRDAVEAVGGFEEHFSGPRQMYEDQAFLAKLYLASPVYFSDQVWLNYRRHDASFVDSVKRAGGYHDVRMYFLTWLERYMCERPISHPQVLRAVRSHIWRARHPLANRLKSAIGRLLRGIRHHASSLSRSASSISDKASKR